MQIPRFTLGWLFLITLVAALTATGARYLLVAQQGAGRQFLVLVVLVLPMLALVVAQALYRGSKLWQAYQRQRRRTRPD